MSIEWQVEIDEYARQVLAKHWPPVPKYGDIRAINWATVKPVDVLCGGFPCQDLSFAGKRAGIDGERSGLWSEYVRAIRALRPRYVIVENVPGLLTNEYMGRVLKDLAESGYDAEWDCIPASAVGANHRRDRVWIMAYPTGERCGEAWTDCERSAEQTASSGDVLAHTTSAGKSQVLRQGGWVQVKSGGSGWENNHWAIEPNVGRVAHGVPNRVDRLRGLGNAVVPQIVEAIGRMIIQAHALERMKVTP